MRGIKYALYVQSLFAAVCTMFMTSCSDFLGYPDFFEPSTVSTHHRPYSHAESTPRIVECDRAQQGDETVTTHTSHRFIPSGSDLESSLRDERESREQERREYEQRLKEQEERLEELERQREEDERERCQREREERDRLERERPERERCERERREQEARERQRYLQQNQQAIRESLKINLSK